MKFQSKVKHKTLENVVCEMSAILSRPQCVNVLEDSNGCNTYLQIISKDQMIDERDSTGKYIMTTEGQAS